MENAATMSVEAIADRRPQGRGKSPPFFINDKHYMSMDRLDYYDIKPAGMDAYLSHYGYHFSKPLYEWAASMMEDRNGNPLPKIDKPIIEKTLKANGIDVKNNNGYDIVYVWAMGLADYFGSSITDEAHLSKFVKDYLDDRDGSKTRAFDEFYAKMVALGIPIVWEDVI